MAENKTEIRLGGSGIGCFTLILSITLLWILLFGLNYEGKHYGFSCGSDGVTVHMGEIRGKDR